MTDNQPLQANLGHKNTGKRFSAFCLMGAGLALIISGTQALLPVKTVDPTSGTAESLLVEDAVVDLVGYGPCANLMGRSPTHMSTQDAPNRYLYWVGDANEHYCYVWQNPGGEWMVSGQ